MDLMGVLCVCVCVWIMCVHNIQKRYQAGLGVPSSVLPSIIFHVHTEAMEGDHKITQINEVPVTTTHASPQTLFFEYASMTTGVPSAPNKVLIMSALCKSSPKITLCVNNP